MVSVLSSSGNLIGVWPFDPVSTKFSQTVCWVNRSSRVHAECPLRYGFVARAPAGFNFAHSWHFWPSPKALRLSSVSSGYHKAWSFLPQSLALGSCRPKQTTKFGSAAWSRDLRASVRARTHTHTRAEYTQWCHQRSQGLDLV